MIYFLVNKYNHYADVLLAHYSLHCCCLYLFIYYCFCYHLYAGYL